MMAEHEYVQARSGTLTRATPKLVLKLINAKNLIGKQSDGSNNKTRNIISWDNFTSEQQDVEKLVYPIVIGDEYDKGCINEVRSQIDTFQGSLQKFNG